MLFFTTDRALSNYSRIFHSSTYWHNMLTSNYTPLIAAAACLTLGFPIACFLALAPSWTSFIFLRRVFVAFFAALK